MSEFMEKHFSHLRNGRKEYTEEEVRTIIEGTIQAERDRLARECSRLPFGDTAASFAVWIAQGGRA